MPAITANQVGFASYESSFLSPFSDKAPLAFYSAIPILSAHKGKGCLTCSVGDLGAVAMDDFLVSAATDPAGAFSSPIFDSVAPKFGNSPPQIPVPPAPKPGLRLKGISCTKVRNGWQGYLVPSNIYLDANLRDDDGTCPGPWNININFNRITGIAPGTNPCDNNPFSTDWPPGIYTVGWPGRGSIISDTAKENPSWQDYGYLSSLYTPEQLSSDVDAMLAGAPFGSIPMNNDVVLAYNSSGQLARTLSTATSFTAVHSQLDSPVACSAITKRAIQFIASGSSYLMTSVPYAGGSSSVRVPCTPGDKITIMPPAFLGVITITQ